VLRKEWQPLEDVVQTSVRTVESGTAGRSVEIALPDDLPLVEFDSVLIERVLTNLLDNAAKHGRGAIGVKARVQGDEIEIDVTDEGAGIAPGDGHVIFRMFEQGAEGGRCGGAGMGLAICKAIVEAHGGRIAARNRPEGGACFSFTLPLGHPPRIDVGGDEPVADR
jgi:two-component system sensor histidine kinase KdpD